MAGDGEIVRTVAVEVRRRDRAVVERQRRKHRLLPPSPLSVALVEKNHRRAGLLAGGGKGEIRKSVLIHVRHRESVAPLLAAWQSGIERLQREERGEEEDHREQE